MPRNSSILGWIKEGLLLNFESRYELVYVNIKTQKDGLNMNPVCSAKPRYVWMAETRFCLIT